MSWALCIGGPLAALAMSNQKIFKVSGVSPKLPEKNLEGFMQGHAVYEPKELSVHDQQRMLKAEKKRQRKLERKEALKR